jgi:hypothetical protein
VEPLAIENREVDGVLGLVDAVLEISKEQPEGGFLWYRGLSNGEHKLIPTIMRYGKTAAEVFDRERRLLTRFRQRSLPYWPSGYPQNNWEHLFAMQHYGIPTRLLDWTENLFVATHFALNGPDTTAPVVWCIDPVRWNRATPVLREYGDSIQVLTTSDDDLEAYRPETSKRRAKSPVAIFGTHNSTRIVAQRGTFMVWGEDPRPMEEFAEEMNTNVWRLELAGDRADLARQLSALGFGETMVFPELQYLASELTKIEGWREVR